MPLTAFIAITISACQTVPERFAQQRPATAGEKAAIVAGARDVLNDPYSIRDAEISNFVPTTSGEGGHICVRANAKNAYGAYTGRKGWLVEMLNGKVVNAWEGHGQCSHPQNRYQPFPEIYALRNL